MVNLLQFTESRLFMIGDSDMTGVAEKRMIKIYLLWVLLVGSLCCSCTGNKRLNMRWSLPGEYGESLVLEHYNDSGLKQDAARF